MTDQNMSPLLVTLLVILRLATLAFAVALFVSGGVYAFVHGFLSLYMAGIVLAAIYTFVFGIARSENAPEAGDIPNPGGRYRR